MKKIPKKNFKHIEDVGYRFKYPVTRTSHGRYYFICEKDYTKIKEKYGNLIV